MPEKCGRIAPAHVAVDAGIIDVKPTRHIFRISIKWISHDARIGGWPKIQKFIILTD
jgi:hypothetical protein